MGVILALAALGIGVLAHRRPPVDRRAVLVSLGALTGGLLVQCAVWFAVGGRLATGVPTLLQALAGVATWWGLARLVAFDAKRRDLVVRGILGVIVALVAATGSSQLAAFFTLFGVLAFRWNRLFTTRERFALTLAALALFVLGLKVPPPQEPAGDALGALLTFGRWAASAAILYAGLASFVLFRAFVRDPSLGIRTVGNRLALSHVLVVVVPLALLGLLWAFTTVLGVNSDRAMVAARAVRAEGRALAGIARTALASPADGASLRTAVAVRGGTWSDAHVWVREHGAWSQLLGDSLGDVAVLQAWPDAPRGPRSAVVQLGLRRFYGAVVRDGADTTRAAIAIVSLDSLLAGDPQRIAESKLLVTSRPSTTDTTARRVVDQVQEVAEGARASQAARRSLRRATPAVRESLSREDSLQLAKLRRVLRGLGVADSTVQLQGRGKSRNRPGVTLNTGGENFDLKSLSPGGNPLLDGHDLLPELYWNGKELQFGRTLLTASLDPHQAVAGLFRNLRENKVSILPLILIAGLTLLFLVLVVLDFGMVVGIGRSITAAIQGLKGGAAKLESGDLAHRVEVKGDDDLWDVADAFNQAMAGFERSRELEQERARLENELALARQIQARLLPAGPPKIPGFEIAGHYDPARQVGGDYFDHLDLGDGRVLLVIADVSGKGVPAALLMSGFRASLMSQSADLAAADPVALCRHLNDFLVRSVETGKFVTGFLAFADARANALHFVNAGHNPPVLLRHDGSHVSLEAGGLMFGVLPGAPYESARVPFSSGDLLVLYTDGVVEGASPAQELWGDDRLIETVKRCAARPSLEVVETIAGEVRAFEGDAGPADDVTLLVARRL